MATNKKTIVFDLDGVIHEYSNGYGTGELGNIIPGAAEALHQLTSNGFNVVICTTRLAASWFSTHKKQDEMKVKIADWLARNEIFQGSHYHDLTGEKVPAIAYVDDRGIRFTNWQDITNYFC